MSEKKSCQNISEVDLDLVLMEWFLSFNIEMIHLTIQYLRVDDLYILKRYISKRELRNVCLDINIYLKNVKYSFKEELSYLHGLRSDDEIRWATRNCYPEVIKYLASKYYSEKVSQHGPPENIRYRGDYKSVYYPEYLIINQGIEEYSRDILNLACENGHLDMVEYLVKHMKNRYVFGESSLNHPSRQALNLASENGHLPVVKLLVKEYRPVQAKGALDRASKNGHVPVVEFLLFKWYTSRYAMTLASSNGHLEVLELLDDFDNYCPKSAIHRACANGHLPIVKFLVEHENKYPFTDYAINWAGKYGHLEIVKFLDSKKEYTLGRIESVMECAMKNKHLNVVNYFESKYIEMVEAGGTIFIIQNERLNAIGNISLREKIREKIGGRIESLDILFKDVIKMIINYL